MRTRGRVTAILCWAIIATSAFAGRVTMAGEMDASLKAKLNGLKVHYGGTFTLPTSHGTLKLSSNYIVALGDDAKKMDEAFGALNPDQNLEAMIVDRASGALVHLIANASGYVALDDWSNLNAAQLVEAAQKTLTGVYRNDRPISIVGWHTEPTLDRASRSVRWSFDVTHGDERMILNFQLALGRFGYEKFVAVAVGSANPADLLDVAVSAFSFAPDARYLDHQPGDQRADVGVAGAVARESGLRTSGAGSFLTTVVFWAMIPFVAVAVFFKRVYWGDSTNPDDSNVGIVT